MCQHIVSKLDRVSTYMDDANYWAPLFQNDDDDTDDDTNENEDQQNSSCANTTEADHTHQRELIRRMI